MWQVIYKHLNYSHLHWLGIFTVDKEYKRKQFQVGRQRKEMKYVLYKTKAVSFHLLCPPTTSTSKLIPTPNLL